MGCFFVCKNLKEMMKKFVVASAQTACVWAERF